MGIKMKFHANWVIGVLAVVVSLFASQFGFMWWLAVMTAGCVLIYKLDTHVKRS